MLTSSPPSSEGRRESGKGGDSCEGRLGVPFGGFLLLTAYFAVHLAADPGVSRPLDVDGADQVAILREAALDTSKLRLRLAVFPGDMSTSRTSRAGVLWWNRDEQAASPGHLVFHLPLKLSPPLVEDGLVESGFPLDVPTGLFDSAGGRSGPLAFGIVNFGLRKAKAVSRFTPEIILALSSPILGSSSQPAFGRLEEIDSCDRALDERTVFAPAEKIWAAGFS